ncbi:hypothetical protein PFISCL1PPCAC_19715 [Pristionchus fissidentatus]|uniref:BZIP domain-containing protein n=1 Tax=Pristionchus fissidentatus TaxID=1538716 RepID=A0AAV5WCJ8_9BILA|nr:hypothetical protein PFISCL1PPCAC_19715 [Pristionchus fissidentatus]
MLKAKRRVLKNRGYALNCRMRRVQNQAQMESDNVQLKDQIRSLRQMVQDLQNRLYYYEQGQHSIVPQTELPGMSTVMESVVTPYAPSDWSSSQQDHFGSPLITSTVKDEPSPRNY